MSNAFSIEILATQCIKYCSNFIQTFFHIITFYYKQPHRLVGNPATIFHKHIAGANVYGSWCESLIRHDHINCAFCRIKSE